MKRSKAWIILAGLVLVSGCSSFVWDPTGIWTFVYGGYSENVTFSGNCDEGIVSNWTGDDYNPQSGTWSKTGDYILEMRIDFISQSGSHVILTITFTSSEDSPNTMAGNAHFVEDSYVEDFTIQASKVTNLQ